MRVPLVDNECKVVIYGVDVDLDDELNEGLKASGVRVMGVKRLRARGQPIETVVVTFKGKQVLEALMFGYLHFRVKGYVLRLIRC